LRALLLIAVIAAVPALTARRAHADCHADETTKIIPLPVWATSPNQGTTWGVMPVFLHVCPDDKRTMWVLAPSVTWNSVIHLTGTARFYDYVAPDKTLSVIAGASTRINYRVIVLWENLPLAYHAWTDETFVRVERDAFARFFGLGYDSLESGETSYTAIRDLVTERRGLNIFGRVNAGLDLGFENDRVGAEGVKGLPLAPDVYPDVAGMHGSSTVIWQGLDLRYDDRDGRDYAISGLRLDAGLSIVEGLRGSPTFLRGTMEGRFIVRELPWLTGAARVAYMGMSAPNAPFYLQPSLGGSFLLRGFTEGRFYASQAWTAEVEQRVRALQTHMFGVVADWRIDPFVAVGQVFDDVGDIIAKPRIAAGVGLRAHVHPNLVGRVDLAEGGEGLKVYVEIGYPY
jgi:hypothetical protein